MEVVLVDPNSDSAQALAAKHGVEHIARSHHEIIDRIDAAIISTPHHTHVPIALDLVDAGVAVLCEKPLGTTVAEVEGLRDLALERGVTVAVNQTRRFIPACAEIRNALKSGRLGRLVSLEVAEGDRFDWPTTTPSMFGLPSGGRGVLLDVGAHVLDLMVWWFGTDLKVIDYTDDSFGGSEASASIALESGGCTIKITLSWLAKQSNVYRFRGDRATLSWGVYDLDLFTLEEKRAARKTVTRISGAPPSFAGLAPMVLQDFFASVDGASTPMAGPDDVLPSMRLIEACYARRTRFEMPWHPLAPQGSHDG